VCADKPPLRERRPDNRAPCAASDKTHHKQAAGFPVQPRRLHPWRQSPRRSASAASGSHHEVSSNGGGVGAVLSSRPGTDRIYADQRHGKHRHKELAPLTSGRSWQILLQKSLCHLIERMADSIACGFDDSLGDPCAPRGSSRNRILQSLSWQSARRHLQQNRHFFWPYAGAASYCHPGWRFCCYARSASGDGWPDTLMPDGAPCLGPAGPPGHEPSDKQEQSHGEPARCHRPFEVVPYPSATPSRRSL
jgi:hypothetical protein